jgi:hypothetical protein
LPGSDHFFSAVWTFEKGWYIAVTFVAIQSPRPLPKKDPQNAMADANFK